MLELGGLGDLGGEALSMHVFYLHGFASSSRSAKAKFLRERFEQYGIDLLRPDLNEPDFSTLTMTRMLEQVAREIEALTGPITLIGSSLGAAVAIHSAARLPDRVKRLVLLAPAILFPRDAAKALGEDRVREWQSTGSLEIFHHVSGALRPLKYDFYEDGLRYDAAAAQFRQPTLIFQGLHDEAVDHHDIQRFADARPNARLVLLNDDHQLTNSLTQIWTEVSSFLGLSPFQMVRS